MTNRGARLARTLVLAAALAAPMLRTAGAPLQAGEAAVQAAFAFNFARFTDWPAPTTGAATSPSTFPFTFCVSGNDPARLAALQGLAGRSVQGRPVQVLAVARAEEARACQVLVVGEAEPARQQAWLTAVAALPVLTVSDADGFARRGGMIGMLRVGDKLRFEINRAQAQQVGLKLAADVLNLAVRVLDTPTRPGEELR